MRFIKIIILLGFISCFAAPLHAQDASPWLLRKEKDGIKVYTRKVAGSPILEYKSTMVVKAPLDQVVQLFEDDSKMTKWFYQAFDCKLVESHGDAHKIYYTAIRLPWPVAKRDVINSNTKTIDPKTLAVSYDVKALPDRLLKRKGRIRITHLKGLWRFTPLENGQTEVYMQQHSDAGGLIPKIIVNKLVVDIPYNSLKNFRKLLNKAS